MRFCIGILISNLYNDGCYEWRDGRITAQTKKNKIIRHKRTMRYFIDAAADIVAQEGVTAVTIRKTADRAGYSSASIYKYFENIDQLVAFAAISSLKAFMDDLAVISTQAHNPLERYVRTIFHSSRHAFQNPKMYRAIFIDRVIEPEEAFEQYYSTFPEERVELPRDLYETFFAHDFHVRTHVLLEQCAVAGFINSEDVDDISVFANIIFEGIIARQAVDAELYNEHYHIRMVKKVFAMHNPALQPMLDAINFDTDRP